MPPTVPVDEMTRETPTMDATAPIIIVGAGRSGTTRLSGALGEHRDVYMIHETSFLLPRLWQTFNERPDYVRVVRLSQLARETKEAWRNLPWGAFWQNELGGDLSALGPLLNEIESSETTRLHRVFGAFLAETLIPPALRRRCWGFKEIWGGGDAFPHDWSLYLAAFPSARFVQSCRHPVDYVRSVFSHLGQTDPDEEQTVHALGQWVAMVRHARALRGTGRYFEFRMEDFDSALPQILDALDLAPDPACEAAARFRYLPSPHRPVPVTAAMIDRAVGLRALAGELGYDLPS